MNKLSEESFGKILHILATEQATKRELEEIGNEIRKQWQSCAKVEKVDRNDFELGDDVEVNIPGLGSGRGVVDKIGHKNVYVKYDGEEYSVPVKPKYITKISR